MPPCSVLNKKTTTRHEATLDMAELREVLGLPADAELTAITSNDGKGTFSIRCAWVNAGIPAPAVAAPVPPPARKAPPAAVAKPQPAPVGTANNGSDTDDDTP